MPNASRTSGEKPTPAERLQWWKDFYKITFEIGALIPFVEEALIGHFSGKKKKRFKAAMQNLYKTIANLTNNHIKKVIHALEAGKEPDVPDIDLPPLPPWSPDDHDKQNTFRNIWYALLPILQTLVERIGKDTDIGLAFLEVISAFEQALDQLKSIDAPGYKDF